MVPAPMTYQANGDNLQLLWSLSQIVDDPGRESLIIGGFHSGCLVHGVFLVSDNKQLSVYQRLPL